jgi:hypothetical protein
MSNTQGTNAHEVAVPGHANLKLRVYGPLKASNLTEDMAQAFTVLKDGVATARGELAPSEKAAVEQLLKDDFPQHAKLL